MAVKSKKICAGMYEVTDTETSQTVMVEFFSEKEDCSTFTGWIARASFDQYLYTDPLPTKKMALQSAFVMLKKTT